MAIGKYERKTYSVTCTECGVDFTVKQVKGSICRKCQKKLKNRKYYQNNKEEIQNKTQEYKENNKEKVLQMYKNYYESNKEDIREKQKDYYQNNKEELLTHYELKRRERGVKPNGLSGTEEVALKFLKEWFKGLDIKQHDRETILNDETGFYLELDFYIPDIDLAIELNGVTHYKPIYGKEKFERQQKNDEIKRSKCKEQGITLVEIPLKDGVHYDKYDIEHKRLKETMFKYLNKFIQFRPDKSSEMCTFEAHIREDK